jgi:alpha-galactosidase
MEKKIVLVGAGSASFGPSTIGDLFLSDALGGSTIMLHDINKEKLEMVYKVCQKENEIRNNVFNIERTDKRAEAFKGADFIISSIEVGDRFDLWRQDYEIPRKYGSTQILGECGGPGGTFHAFRILPQVIEIVKDAEKICPNAFFINFSNPLARVCLAIKRSTENLKFTGLCHQIGFFNLYLPKILDIKLKDLKMTVVGLNHFGFLLNLENIATGENLMSKFHSRALDYFTKHEHRFIFSTLTFEVYKRFGYFPHAGDNHLGEYLQFGEEFTKQQDMVDWINRTENFGETIYGRFERAYKRLNKGRYLRKGFLLRTPSGERAIPIIEEILTDKKNYESSVNIPNDKVFSNLPQNLIVK